jgi:hypothetical protein
MQAIKVCLTVLFLLMPSLAAADDYFAAVKTDAELFGCWKRIIFPEETMRKMNKFEPYPLQHQWYCFFPNGKYAEVLSNRDGDIEEHLQMMQIFPMQDYSIPKEGLVLIHHNEARQSTYWVTSTLLKDRTIVKAGDVLMTIRNPRTQEDVYYRFMTKVKSF